MFSTSSLQEAKPSKGGNKENMPLRSSTRNILNPEASEPDKILGQKNRDKVSVKNLEAIALDV
jgi:hypothetical protein